MKTLIIGAGQVGSALYENLKGHYETHIRDVNEYPLEGVRVLQICFPDHDGFHKTTLKYIEQYKPQLTIINSSVSVGTTAKCGDDIIYSPVRGRHPKLAEEMKKYAKFVSGHDKDQVSLAAGYFMKTGWKVIKSDCPDSIEFMKLISNVHMGLEIAWRQEVQRMLEHFGISERDYDRWEDSYRDGYFECQDLNLIRPRMNPNKIGGHCVRQCTEILKDQFESKALEFILKSDSEAWFPQKREFREAIETHKNGRA